MCDSKLVEVRLIESNLKEESCKEVHDCQATKNFHYPEEFTYVVCFKSHSAVLYTGISLINGENKI